MSTKLKLLLFLILFGSNVIAQPFTLDPKIRPVEIKLHKFNPASEPKAKGRLGIAEVNQQKDTLYYFVKGASIYSSIYVGVQNEDASKSIKVSLHKMNWKQSDRSGETNSSGSWKELFKTENDFGIRIISNGETIAYSLIVWVGDEPKMELPTLFKKAGLAADGNFFKDNLMYILIAALIVLLVFIFFKNKKNKPND